MFSGFDMSSGEIRKLPKDIRTDMPRFFDEMKVPDNIDLNIPLGQKEAGKETGMQEINALLKNKQEGLQREQDVAKDLNEEYPQEEGYSVISEVTLRDKDGNIVKDSKTGEARRIDFAIVKDGKVVDTIEVTSKSASKSAQLEKEDRIREAGGNYIKDNSGNLVEIPRGVRTRIERRD